jgi:diguanylate cyclase (GGDEF)-like protein
MSSIVPPGAMTENDDTSSTQTTQRRTLRDVLRWRFGITAYLAASFAAVAALAAITNVIVEQGMSIVEITRVAPVPAVDTERASAQAAAEVGLGDAIDRFSRAVLQRAATVNNANAAELDTARRNLDARARSAASELVVAEAQGVNLTAALEPYRNAAAEVLRLADRRQALATQYTTHLDEMAARLDESADGGMRIFGRVLARENVVALRGDHDDIRYRFGLAVASAGLPTVELAGLAEAEAAFAGTLDDNQRRFSRREGAEWLSAMRSELASAAAVREELGETWRALDSAASTLAARQAAAEKALFEVARQSEQYAADQAAAAAAEALALSAEGASGSVSVSVGETAHETRLARTEPDTEKRRLVGWLTGGTLLVVLMISIGTVRSIVVPIRRLLDATSRLGKHGVHEPVPGGGIRELDTLAESFNRMGEELVAARRSTERHKLELEERVAERTRQLRELAERDPLTGLPNRRHLSVLLAEALDDAAQSDALVAVLFLDLDNFKNVNDSMGHGFGDDVLQSVAAKLEQLVAGRGFAARLGGDEFTVVLTHARDEEHVDLAGREIVTAFQNPISVGGRDLVMSVSAGASIYPRHAQDAEELLKAADAALFRAKALGRSRLSVFTPELLAEAAERFSTEQGLRRAIEQSEFELVFQPEVDAETMQTVVVEALLRWRLPDGSLAAPDQFLSVADESGLIAEISDWVLRSAIEAAAEWRHGAWPDVRVAINVSARQLLDPHFVDKVEALLGEFDVPASAIEIELTEHVLQTSLTTIDTLGRLHDAGVAIALDDFGTGYSSLASLEKLPFSRIKLDRSLVAGIATSARSAAIARAIVWLCQSLSLRVTAEGVETMEQLQVLHAHRPIYLQGFLLSKAVPRHEVLATAARIADELPALVAAAEELRSDEILSIYEHPAATRKRRRSR